MLEPIADILKLTEEIPEIQWDHEDDLCDCTFQRIGWWTNPYIGKTLEVRWCCTWKKLMEMFPELHPFIREIPAFDNYNQGRYEFEPHEWDGDSDMPRSIWYRQLATQEGLSLPEVRHRYDHLNAPKAVIARLWSFQNGEEREHLIRRP